MPIEPIPAGTVRQATCRPESFLDITTGEDELMTSSANCKPKQRPVLAANLVQILAELHQLATANARPSATDNRSGSVGAPTMVIRGK